MIRLRPHHLLCMLTYVGKGYTKAFTANFDRLLPVILAGNPLQIVLTPDDICQPLLNEPDEVCHCFNASVCQRDKLAQQDMSMLGFNIEDGQIFSLTPQHIQLLRQAFAAGTIRRACHGCQWYELCTSVSHQFEKE